MSQPQLRKTEDLVEASQATEANSGLAESTSSTEKKFGVLLRHLKPQKNIQSLAESTSATEKNITTLLKRLRHREIIKSLAESRLSTEKKPVIGLYPGRHTRVAP